MLRVSARNSLKRGDGSVKRMPDPLDGIQACWTKYGPVRFNKSLLEEMSLGGIQALWTKH